MRVRVGLLILLVPSWRQKANIFLFGVWLARFKAPHTSNKVSWKLSVHTVATFWKIHHCVLVYHSTLFPRKISAAVLSPCSANATLKLLHATIGVITSHARILIPHIHKIKNYWARQLDVTNDITLISIFYWVIVRGSNYIFNLNHCFMWLKVLAVKLSRKVSYFIKLEILVICGGCW